MKHTRLLQGILGLAAVLALSACGNKLPEIQPELLHNKFSALVITGPDLSDQQKIAIQSGLSGWNGFQITYEWVRDINGFEPDLEQKIEARTYDYIVTAGKSLTAGALAEADKLKQAKWIVLQNGNEPALPAGKANVMSRSWMRKPSPTAAAVGKNAAGGESADRMGDRFLHAGACPMVPFRRRGPYREDRSEPGLVQPADPQCQSASQQLDRHLFFPRCRVPPKKINSLRIPVVDMSVVPAGEVQWPGFCREFRRLSGRASGTRERSLIHLKSIFFK